MFANRVISTPFWNMPVFFPLGKSMNTYRFALCKEGSSIDQDLPWVRNEVRWDDFLANASISFLQSSQELGGSAALLQVEGLSIKRPFWRQRGGDRERPTAPHSQPSRPQRLRRRSPRCHCWGSRGPIAPSRPRRQRARDARGTTWHRTHSLHCLQRSRAACCAVKQRDREDFVALPLPRAV